jgi:hypothetical protein
VCCRAAPQAVDAERSLFLVGFGVLFLQIGWVLISAFQVLAVHGTVGPAAGSTSNSNARSLSSSQKGVYFLLLVSFYWGLQVCRNLMRVVVAGTVAAWWFYTAEASRVGGSVKRACTTSFGSICLGSLIVAVLTALERAAESMRDDDGGGALACCLQCILSYIRQIMEYFNRWAFTYVGIYGHKFSVAGKAVYELFKQRGWSAIINDQLLQDVFGIVALGVGCASALVGVLVLAAAGMQTDGAVFGFAVLFCFVLGLCIATVFTDIIDGSITTVFVCFAEDPSALQQTHPEEHRQLMAAWTEIYHEEMVQCGYVVM